jgi:hypothetical protein
VEAENIDLQQLDTGGLEAPCSPTGSVRAPAAAGKLAKKSSIACR